METVATTGKRIKIENLLTFMQRGLRFYCFTLSAQRLLDCTRVDRYQDAETGVQRQQHEGHVTGIAEAMGDDDVFFTEPFTVFLEGEWTLRGGVLSGKPGCYLSVDNGQHRLEALRRLTPEQLEQLEEFVVIAMPLELSYQQRIRIFLQQSLNKRIDGRLRLAQRGEIGDWTPSEEAAYTICQALHEDEDSPLHGRVNLHDTGSRVYERGGNQAAGVNVLGLFKAVHWSLSEKSLLSQLTVEEQTTVIKNTLSIAEQMWPKVWKSNEHILSTTKGIEALLRLFVNSSEFRSRVGDDLRKESLVKIFELLKTYTWTRNHNSHASALGITGRLNEMLARRAQGPKRLKVN